MNQIIAAILMAFTCFNASYAAEVNNKSDNDITFEEINKVNSPLALLVLFQYSSNETQIPEFAVDYNIQCIAIKNVEFLNDSVYQKIKLVILQAIEKLGVSNSNIFIGGFSGGGFNAIRFTEMAVEQNDSIIIPNAIFAIDPPLDLLQLYEYCENEINFDCDNADSKTIGKSEAKWIKQDLESRYGNPKTDSSKYSRNSCFSEHLDDGGNAKYLKHVPINMIHEIDIMWKITERCRDLRFSSVLSSSIMVNKLYNWGNMDAIITITNGLGYRANGKRNPHSWSIAEPKPTINWMMKYLKK